MSGLTIYFIIYGILALSHIAIQMILGHAEHKRQEHDKFRSKHSGHLESVTVVVPVYNEAAFSLNDCISSIYDQEYKGQLHIIVVDDGSDNYEEINREVYSKYNHGKLEVVRLSENGGKRHAQKIGFDKAKGDIIVTIDSDTILRSKKAIGAIVQRFVDPQVGAVTGHVKVENGSTNLLTKLIETRYWMAFNQERAAQSFFNVLMCCSGPFSAYRKDILDKLKHKYVSQKFLGKPCTFGDDRHLTNLVLVDGHDVVYDKHAIAYTHVPEKIGEYLKQQLRWNKSFYREVLWTLKSVNKHHAYLVYDLIMQIVLPFMLLFALGFTLVKTFQGQFDYLYVYVLTIVAISVLRTSYGLFRTKNSRFILFILYGFVHVLLLIPTRIYALITIRKTEWGTR